MTDDEMLRVIADQLRKPSGEYAIQVGEKMNESNWHLHLNTFEELHLIAGDKVLEIGMGNGYFVKNIVAHDATINYIGCDYSEVMVTEAQKLNAHFIESGQVQFHVADAHNLPYKSATFNKIFTINTIYFWNYPQKVLAEIARVLKPKGTITIAIRPKSVMEHYPFVKFGFNTFTKENLETLLSENNFKIVDILEKDEPEIEINGVMEKAATLLITAQK